MVLDAMYGAQLDVAESKPVRLEDVALPMAMNGVFTKADLVRHLETAEGRVTKDGLRNMGIEKYGVIEN